MKITTTFPSKYLKAADIADDRTIQLKIDRVVVETVGKDNGADSERPVMYFVGKTKGLVLNKTNASTIAEKYGDETEDWADKPIGLCAEETDFQGRRVPCLRVTFRGLSTQEEVVHDEDIPF